MASHGLLATALPILSAAVGSSGLAAVGTLALKRREARNAEQQGSVAAAQTLTTTALSLLEPVKRALGEAEERIKALQKQVIDLETAAGALTAAMETLAASSQAKLAALETELAEVTAERDVANAELSAATGERDTLLAKLADREAQLAARDAELDALRRQNHGRPA